MTDEQLEPRLQEAARAYHRPPATPRERIWRRIEAARAARRRRAMAFRSVLGWGVGLAAVLVLGVAVGRWSARLGSGATATPSRTAESTGTLAYRLAAAQYLTRTEALLTRFRTEPVTGAPEAQFGPQARDLLATTRLMLDSPAAKDVRLKGLLEDLELVLAEIAQLPATGYREDVQLINQGLERRSVLLRLRAASPDAATRGQGAL